MRVIDPFENERIESRMGREVRTDYRYKATNILMRGRHSL